MKKIGKITFTLFLVVAGAFIAVWTYSTFFDKPHIITIKQNHLVQSYTNLRSREIHGRDQ